MIAPRNAPPSNYVHTGKRTPSLKPKRKCSPKQCEALARGRAILAARRANDKKIDKNAPESAEANDTIRDYYKSLGI